MLSELLRRAGLGSLITPKVPVTQIETVEQKIFKQQTALGDSCIANGRFEESILPYRNALANNTESREAMFNYAVANRLCGTEAHLKSATIWFEQALGAAQDGKITDAAIHEQVVLLKQARSLHTS